MVITMKKNTKKGNKQYKSDRGNRKMPRLPAPKGNQVKIDKSFEMAWELAKSDDKGDNAPTNPKLWAQAKSKARSKFKVYPSAYANGWASKWYKSKGGGWKKKGKKSKK